MGVHRRSRQKREHLSVQHKRKVPAFNPDFFDRCDDVAHDGDA